MRRIIPAALAVLVLGCLAPGKAAAEELKMSYNSDWPPYSSGVGVTVKGILPDLMTEIAGKRMGLKVTHHGYPWKRAQKAVEMGNLDAMVTVPTESRLGYAESSKNTVYTIEMRPIVAIGGGAEKKISAAAVPATLKTMRLCDIVGNGWGKRFAETNELSPIMASKVASCLRMIVGNRTDVTIQSVAVANEQIRSEKLQEKLSILPTAFGRMNFTLLLSKNSKHDPDFMARFDKVLGEMIADGSYAALIERLRSGGYGG